MYLKYNNILKKNSKSFENIYRVIYYNKII